MNDAYYDAFKTLDKSKLMTKEGLLTYLKEHGEHAMALAQLSDEYTCMIGIDPIWHYPLSDDRHNGAFIIPVQEGYAWLPYDEVSTENYEILLTDQLTILNAECCIYFATLLQEFTDDLCRVLEVIQRGI